MSRRPAFSLMELLVVVAVLAILIALSVPMLARSRLSATELACLQVARSTAQNLQVFAGSNAESPPVTVPASREVVSSPAEWHRYGHQALDVLASPAWLDFAGIGGPARCPGHRDVDERTSTDFILSAAVYAETSFLNPALPAVVWRSRLGAKVQPMSATGHPAKKVMVIERFVWHGWRGSTAPGSEIGSLLYYESRRAGTLAMFDGHAAQAHARNALAFVNRWPDWPFMPFGTTAWGVAGRDLP